MKISEAKLRKLIRYVIKESISQDVADAFSEKNQIIVRSSGNIIEEVLTAKDLSDRLKSKIQHAKLSNLSLLDLEVKLFEMFADSIYNSKDDDNTRRNAVLIEDYGIPQFSQEIRELIRECLREADINDFVDCFISKIAKNKSLTAEMYEYLNNTFAGILNKDGPGSSIEKRIETYIEELIKKLNVDRAAAENIKPLLEDYYQSEYDHAIREKKSEEEAHERATKSTENYASAFIDFD